MKPNKQPHSHHPIAIGIVEEHALGEELIKTCQRRAEASWGYKTSPEPDTAVGRIEMQRTVAGTKLFEAYRLRQRFEELSRSDPTLSTT